jgi:NADH dehydrogenase (ubiquinone) Fe-S protein 4
MSAVAVLRHAMRAPRSRAFSALAIKESHDELPGAGSGCPHTELLGRKVLIYQRPKNSMTSGTAGMEGWAFEFEHTGHWYNPLMGYTSTSDPVGTLRMTFATQQDAINFAQKQGLSYSVEPSHPRRKFIKSFEGNFKFKYASIPSLMNLAGIRLKFTISCLCRGVPKKPEEDI